jgi:hypothetical protein
MCSAPSSTYDIRDLNHDDGDNRGDGNCCDDARDWDDDGTSGCNYTCDACPHTP